VVEDEKEMGFRPYKDKEPKEEGNTTGRGDWGSCNFQTKRAWTSTSLNGKPGRPTEVKRKPGSSLQERRKEGLEENQAEAGNRRGKRRKTNCSSFFSRVGSRRGYGHATLE